MTVTASDTGLGTAEARTSVAQLPAWPQDAQMGALQFIAAMTSALAWPAIALVAVLIFRRRVSRWFSDRPSSLELGPFKAAWETIAVKATAEAAADLPESPEAASPESLKYMQIAKKHPDLAVLGAWKELETILVDLVASSGAIVPKHAPIDRQVVGLVTPEVSSVLRSLRGMRNLAVHGNRDEVGYEQAKEFVLLSEAAKVMVKNNRP